MIWPQSASLDLIPTYRPSLSLHSNRPKFSSFLKYTLSNISAFIFVIPLFENVLSSLPSLLIEILLNFSTLHLFMPQTFTECVLRLASF